MKHITRQELIILAGLSATVYPEEVDNEGALMRLHTLENIEYVKNRSVKITRRADGRLNVVVGGSGAPTT